MAQCILEAKEQILIASVCRRLAAQTDEHEQIRIVLNGVTDMGDDTVENSFCLDCRYTNFVCIAVMVPDTLKQDSSYNKRPRLRKEDCNGEYP